MRTTPDIAGWLAGLVRISSNARALLRGLARRHGVPLVTFDVALATLGRAGETELPAR